MRFKKSELVFVLSQLSLTMIAAFRFTNNTWNYVTPFTIDGTPLQYVGLIDAGFFVFAVTSLICIIFDAYYSNFCYNAFSFMDFFKNHQNVDALKWGLGFFLLMITIVGSIVWSPFAYYLAFISMGPLLIFSIYHFKRNPNILQVKGRFKEFCLILLILSLPILVGGALFFNALNNANSLPSEAEKVSFAAEYTNDHTFSIWYTTGTNCFRSGNDMLGFFVLGYSGCGELQYIEMTMLGNLGLNTVAISLPCENHVFLEALVNGTWEVSDPGYPGSQLCTPWERGQSRLDETGGLSLAFAMYSNGTIVWCTNEFVETDAVTIQITSNGIPYTNGSIVLGHRFEGQILWTPAIPLNSSGELTLQIGDTKHFTTSSTDPFLLLSVDGIQTDVHVYSSGINSTSEYCYDIGS